MKKIFLSVVTTLLLVVASAPLTMAQIAKTTIKFPSQVNSEIKGYSPGNLNATKDFGEVNSGSVKKRAVKNFTRSFKNVTNVKWYITDEGYAVYFTADDICSRVFYNKNGTYESMLHQYCGDKLSPEIYNQIKNEYPDFTIYYINEVNARGLTAYFVTLESKTYWKTIRIMDGEIEIIEEYLKS